MINQIQTGAQSTSGVAVVPARGGQQGDAIVSGLHGPYYEQSYRSNRFSASTQAVATSTVGLATTYTGLVISNPITSVVNLVLDLASVMQSVVQAVQIEAYAIACGYNATTNVTHTTPLTVRSKKIGSGASGTGVADISATLPTAPFYDTFVHNTGTAIANGTGAVIDLQGSIILIPGAYACWVTPAQASVAGLWFSFSWEEVPV